MLDVKRLFLEVIFCSFAADYSTCFVHLAHSNASDFAGFFAPIKDTTTLKKIANLEHDVPQNNRGVLRVEVRAYYL